MTIASNDRISGPYLGDGSTAQYTIDFFFLADTDIEVYQRDADDNETLVSSSDYTVTGAGSVGGPRYITLDSNLTSGYKLTIVRSMDFLQSLDLGEGDNLPSGSLETAFDKLTMMCQQLLGLLDRAVLLPTTTALSDVAFPDGGASQANTVIGWDSTGLVLENKGDETSSAAAAAASAAAAAASAASINLPSISISDAGSSLEVNSAGDGYDKITQYDRLIRYSVFKDAFV